MGASNQESDLPARLLKIEEVAKTWGVSPRTVRRWIDQGEMPVFRFGGIVRIAERDVKRFYDRYFDRHRTYD